MSEDFQYRASNEHLLLNPTKVLQDMSLRLTEHRMNLKERCVGSPIVVGTFRGTVSSISHGHAIARSASDASERKIALNGTRIRQLLAGDTQRK